MGAYITIKRGDTLSRSANYIDSDGNAVDLTDIDIFCQIRDRADTLYATCAIYKADQSISAGEFIFAAETNTSNWPIGQMFLDFKMVKNSVSIHSRTLTIRIEPSETRNG